MNLGLSNSRIIFFLYCIYVGANVFNILPQSSFLYVYYHILLNFNSTFKILYFLAIGREIMNVLSIIPYFLYVFRIKLGKPVIWKSLLALRLILDISGSSAQINFYKALYHSDGYFFYSTLIFISSLIISSYIACFRYAFFWQKLLPKD